MEDKNNVSNEKTHLGNIILFFTTSSYASKFNTAVYHIVWLQYVI